MRYLFCLFFMIRSAIAQPDNVDKIIQNTSCTVDFFQQLYQDIQNQNTTKAMLSV